jgi:hypothetical protein
MARVSDRHLRQLKPFLVGEQPKTNGEWDMHCPLHEDNKRSASLNILTGQWYCHAEGRGGGVLDLIRAKSHWVPFDVAATNGSSTRSTNGASGAPSEKEPLTMGMIEGWHAVMMRDDSALDDLVTARGVHTKTIIDRRIGYNVGGRHYTIPVFGPDREIWNVRRYDLYAKEGRRKIWSTSGWGSPPRLYPYDQLQHDRLVIGEGEWDILLTIQNGYPAITKTAGATMWDYGWNELFKDKLVYIALDRDDDGQKGAKKIARALHRIADVRMVELPYDTVPKHGKDLTDFWNDHDRGDFEALLADAKPWKAAADKATTDDPNVITVLDSFDAHKVGDPVKLQVTIKGKKEPGYSVPHKAKLSCTQDRGPVCNVCPLNAKNGEMDYTLEPQSPAILGLLDERSGSIGLAIGSDVGIPGGKTGTCPKLTIEVTDHQAVEILFARPSIDHADGTQAKDYKNVKITSVGRHDTMANTTVVVTGALYPGPKDQRNEFLAWKVEEQETSVDRFQMSEDAVRQMMMFQPTGRQTPLKKLSMINKEFAAHVTRIVGRPEMHALMDLTYHSALSFKFGGQLVHRGWLESLVVGDTRTGKSEAGERLVRHFGAGEIVGGEAATLAGLVGGMQQIGGKDWTVTWGVIPINDRRLVIIDELSGLHPDEIAKMSDVRASGMARLTKILQEVTFARTRLLWLGNPRHGDMSNYTYGVDAVRPLIGNPEDVARFDLVMAVAQGDVPPEDYNKPPVEGVLRYPSDACHTLLMWVWTRRADQIVWAAGAEDCVYKLAMEMGKRYTEDPPILQAANARIKIARVAVALAARTFSTDEETHEKVIVTAQHVEDAVSFMDTVYSLDSFGYAERSRERLDDIAEAKSNVDATRTYLLERKGLAKFLRSNPAFRRQDLEEILNLDRDACNAVINKLWNSRMVRKEGANVKVEPTLHGILREVRW